MRSFTLLLVLCLAACGTPGVPRLGSGDFVASDVNGVPIAGEKRLTLRLGEDGQASGNSGCNSFTATYQTRSRERIDFGPIASTRMACPPDVMEQEARYLAILDAAESYSVYGNGSLSIIAPDGRAVRFRR